MEVEEFKNLIEQKSNRINIKINENEIKDFYNYMNLLLEWNEKINLTAITEEEDVITKHFIDSLTVLKYINNKDKLIDIGTGAGFPGIPLKILKQDIECMLLDSLNKRIIFLDEIINKLDLKNIKTIHGRAEELGQNEEYRAQYDVAVSRALAGLNVLLEYISPYVKVGGRCICMKGPNIEEELKNSRVAINMLGLEIEKIDNFYLPDTDMERNIIVFQKVENTKERFPRKQGDIRKLPL